MHLKNNIFKSIVSGCSTRRKIYKKPYELSHSNSKSQCGLRVEPNILRTISIHGLTLVKVTLSKRLIIFAKRGYLLHVYTAHDLQCFDVSYIVLLHYRVIFKVLGPLQLRLGLVISLRRKAPLDYPPMKYWLTMQLDVEEIQ